MNWNLVDMHLYIRIGLKRVAAGFLNFSVTPPPEKNIVFIFLELNVNRTPLDRYWRVFGQNFLASYWSGQQALASCWLDKAANFTPAYLTNHTLLWISKTPAASHSTFIIV